jgi:hypothetical protein
MALKIFEDKAKVPEIGLKRGGRPRVAAEVSMLPACTVATSIHDAACAEALRRDVSVARVVRDALFFYLKTRQQQTTSA